MRKTSGVIRLVFGAIAIGSVLAACSSEHPVLEAVAQHEAQWNLKRPANYHYAYYVGGMAGECSIFIRVRDSKIASAKAQKPCGWELDLVHPPTIKSLFRRIKDAYRHSDQVGVTYDPTYGYPVSVGVDPEENTYDDESGFGARGFKADGS